MAKTAIEKLNQDKQSAIKTRLQPGALSWVNGDPDGIGQAQGLPYADDDGRMRRPTTYVCHRVGRRARAVAGRGDCAGDGITASSSAIRCSKQADLFVFLLFFFRVPLFYERLGGFLFLRLF